MFAALLYPRHECDAFGFHQSGRRFVKVGRQTYLSLPDKGLDTIIPASLLWVTSWDTVRNACTSKQYFTRSTWNDHLVSSVNNAREWSLEENITTRHAPAISAKRNGRNRARCLPGLREA